MTQFSNLPRGYLHVEQYKRVLRWYKRFKEINDGKRLDDDFNCQDDDMLAFFMNCHHLKDWVIQDFFVEASDPDIAKYCRLRDEVVRFVDSNECLMICSNICNGAKHLRRQESPHFKESLRVRTEIHIDETIKNPPVKRVWKITSESRKEWDAFELTSECVKKWHEFLNNHANLIRELSRHSFPAQGRDGVDDTYLAKLRNGDVIGTKGTTIYHVTRKSKPDQ